MAINNVGKTAYIYQNGTWYALSGSANTALNYTWNGTHQFDNLVTATDVVNARAGVNNFMNPAHRDLALSSPVRGIVCFIAENENSVRVDQLQYFDGSSWKNISGYKTISSKIASYTLTAADNSKVITIDSPSAATITIPANLTTAIPVGYSVEIIQLGVGSTTIVPESVSVSVKSKNNTMILDGQFSKATLIKLDTNTWSLFGDIYENVSQTPTPTAPTPTAPTPTAPTPTAPTPTAPTPTAPTPTAPTPAPTPYPNISGVTAYGAGTNQTWTSNAAYITWGGSLWGSYKVVPNGGATAVNEPTSSTANFPVLLTGLSPSTNYSVTVTLYAGANYTGATAAATGSFTTAAATPTPTAPTPTAPTPTAPTPTAPSGQNTYSFTYYDGKCNYAVYAPGGTSAIRNYSTNLCVNSGVDETGATLPSCSNAGCTGPTPTPTAPTPTAPTPTAPTPTAPTPTGPICPSNSTYGVTQGGVYSGSCPDGSCPGCSNYMQSWYKCSDGTSGITFYTGLGCSTPTPTAPTPTAPTPTAPTPTAPTPTAPTPTAPTPTAPTPTAPTPTAVTYSTSGPSLSTVTCSNGGTTNSKYVSNPSTQSISNGVCGTVSWYAYTTGTWNVGCCAS